MFDFENVNQSQRQAIEATDGPVLIIAGPGTGKTHTIVQRAIYLIVERGVEPEQILMATFTEKAAKELVTRITDALAKWNIPVNIADMYVGTFHSLCLRIIKEHLEYTRLKKSFRTLEQFDQRYEVFLNIRRFRPYADALFPEKKTTWQQAGEICNLVDQLAEELVDPAALKADEDPKIAALGGLLETYQAMLKEKNLVDFAALQTVAYRLLADNPDILAAIREQIRYIMIDEYQDTNYIQEQLVFLLGGEHGNICVVGDDDQGLYRFRGATIRNIIEFPQKFAEGECQIIRLVKNYRSNSDIVDFYNVWMSTTSGEGFRFDLDQFRHRKTIEPKKKSTLKSPAVVKLAAVNDEKKWHERILAFIRKLREEGKLSDLNQIAFLFRSVQYDGAGLADFLEANGINVYSPRSAKFFERQEIKLLLGCLMLMFPGYTAKLEGGEHKYLGGKLYYYYRDIAKLAKDTIAMPENSGLRAFIEQQGAKHASLKETTDYAYSDLLYQLFAYPLFASFLDTDLESGVIDARPARNIALLTKIVSKYEYLENIEVLNGLEYNGIRKIDKDTEILFNLYLKLLYDGGVGEYEDESEYAPSGCVSFFTIHQAKGMEFPIVFVDSLASNPREPRDDEKALLEILKKVEEKYFHRPAFEPYDQVKFFDFWRLYYTAFSRAQNLLVLACNETSGWRTCPAVYFRKVYDDLADADSIDLAEFDFETVKDVDIKGTFSFTSHITVYETCSLQYKFYKELEFAPNRKNATLFGMLVHQTIEDIHRAALRGEEQLINTAQIESWFSDNYTSLTNAERVYLNAPQKQGALESVQRYAQRHAKDWGFIQQVEVAVSHVKPEYIIEGKIDLIKGEGDTVELVDFKSEARPDPNKQSDDDKEHREHYQRQLQLYAYLVEERLGQKVSKMHLYYTSTKDGDPRESFDYSQTAIDETLEAFDKTVQRIQGKEFKTKASNRQTCDSCDFRHYCQGK
jgi:DNA helicase-2/ATP-dependent DNA helicase PcrA